MRRTFFQTHLFSKKLTTRGGDVLLMRVEDEILKNPEAGVIVAGTDGVRKLRIADFERKKGKRGGFRILYLDLPDCQETYLITVKTRLTIYPQMAKNSLARLSQPLGLRIKCL